MNINLTTPITREKARELKAGDLVKIAGIIYSAERCCTQENVRQS